MNTEIDFQKMQGLVPVTVQDAQTQVVLMTGFMNEEAYRETLRSNKVTFYSRTKGRLWVKGETSGNFLEVKEVLLDCDKDSLLIKALPAGPVCHTGSETCYGEENCTHFSLETLEEIIAQRLKDESSSSYTFTLYQRGVKRVAQKVGEEGVEVALAAIGDDQNELLNEAADLFYHLLVLLKAKNVSLTQVLSVLEGRGKT